MTMMTKRPDPTAMTDPQTIVEGMTRAQRACIRKMSADPVHPNDVDEQGSRMAALVKRGIAYRVVCTMTATDESFNGYGLTPLGLAVRTHMEKESKK